MMNSAREVAEMFLRTCAGPHDVRDTRRLELLLSEFAMAGHELALDKAQSMYRRLHSGGCRVLSRGDECACFLCQVDRAKLRGPRAPSATEPATEPAPRF
jgi:hypothetical protein